jgi:hypothetical protein
MAEFATVLADYLEAVPSSSPDVEPQRGDAEPSSPSDSPQDTLPAIRPRKTNAPDRTGPLVAAGFGLALVVGLALFIWLQLSHDVTQPYDTGRRGRPAPAVKKAERDFSRAGDSR